MKSKADVVTMVREKIREIRGGSSLNGGGHPGQFTGGNGENGGRCHHETRETHEKWAAGF